MPQPKKTSPAKVAGEVNGHRKTLVFEGEKFDVPPELPFTCAAFWQEGEVLNAIRGLFSNAQDVGRFMEASRGLSVAVWTEKFGESIDATYEVESGG